MDNLDSSVTYQTMPVLHFSIVFHARVLNVFGFYILSTLHNVAISQSAAFNSFQQRYRSSRRIAWASLVIYLICKKSIYMFNHPQNLKNVKPQLFRPYLCLD